VDDGIGSRVVVVIGTRGVVGVGSVVGVVGGDNRGDDVAVVV
jgi:hypothetical protein